MESRPDSHEGASYRVNAANERVVLKKMTQLQLKAYKKINFHPQTKEILDNGPHLIKDESTQSFETMGPLSKIVSKKTA